MHRAWGYFLKQGFRNIWHHRMTSFASTGIVASSLLFLGVFMLLQMNLTSFLDQVREQFEINVYLSKDAGGATLAQVETNLKKIHGVTGVRYRSKEERLEQVRETMYQGKEHMLDGLEDDNPLRDAYILEIDETTETQAVVMAAEKIKGVSEVSSLLELEYKLERLSNTVRLFGMGLMFLFAFAALFIIANTIRMGMFARSHEIEIMRYVGASLGYIYGPFAVEGIFLGLLGGLIASGLLLWGYGAMITMLHHVLQMDILHTVKTPQAAQVIIPSFLGIGLCIGALGSGISMRKYLKV